MKVIDLLNKIANKEEVPKKVKWNYHIYIYDEQYDDYFEETTALFQNEMSNGMLFKSLNDEVEIIEEKPKEIKPIKKNENRNDKINEIIVALNSLLKKEVSNENR